jgi:crotonobetainyl-CoA:carnitine CoA-transferase CaiB-like acyl-CoA transferase
MILQGIRLLDLSRMLPGPYATMLLGDLGADVIRVENPEEIDLAMLAPPLVAGIGSLYLMVNRNKKSITLNLKNDGAAEVFRDLAKTADVVFEQFRPGVVNRLGIGYEDIKKVKPDIIYCSLTGFGQHGPYRNRPGHDINYLSIAGFMDVNKRDGEAPVVPGVPVADLTGGIFAALSVLAALFARERTGRGQHIDVAMTDVIVSMACSVFGELAADEREEKTGLSSLMQEAPFYGVYETKDGEYVSIGAIEPKFWRGLCEELGHPELVPKQFVFGEGARETSSVLADVFKSRTKEEWEERLGEKDVMFTPVNSLREMVDDPHVSARQLIGTIRHPVAGEVRQIKFPVRFGDSVECLREPPPSVGEHTDQILGELGYGEDKIKELRQRLVI